MNPLPLKRWYLSQSIFIHLLFWVLMWVYLSVMFSREPEVKAFIEVAVYLPGSIVTVYALVYLLVPRYLLQRRFLEFFAGLTLLTGTCMLLTYLAQSAGTGTREIGEMVFGRWTGVLIFLHSGGIAVLLKLLIYGYQQKKLVTESETCKTTAEIQMLKAQLHPHFLFNALNNLYSHTLEVSPKSPEIVMKLAGLLQFMIYESEAPRIPLTKEINLLKNYIALEKLCCEDRIDISFTIRGEIEQYQIAPLMLLPFLENAFKHGTGQRLDQSWISLDVTMEGPVLHFKLLNSMEGGGYKEETKTGGMGLQNARRRLKLIYKNRFRLNAEKLEEVFAVNLQIALEPLEMKFADKEFSGHLKTTADIHRAPQEK